MTLKAYNILIFLFPLCIWAQQQITGTIIDPVSNTPISGVAIYDKTGGLLSTTDINGNFRFTTTKDKVETYIYLLEYDSKEVVFTAPFLQHYNLQLTPITESLTAVEINARKAKTFELQRLKDVEGTAIYAGKKTEVVLVDQSSANLATNNARQIYAQVSGLNIFQNDDAGLQLNIGGRGLDPNRTSNFNTRQNGYDISADVLGYPESYYAPPAEAIEQIQIIRGAASLQYGTQFGGLVNFKLRSPIKNKKFQGILRNTIGNNGLYTNFTSASGSLGKFSYYTFFNYKQGDGFRPNSGFNSRNFYTHLDYQVSNDTKLSGEFTYLNYLAQQAGGLTDDMFNQDPLQSNRSRNWFKVNWLLWNFKLEHQFSKKTKASLSLFGLDATRKAIGFRTNRVSQVDSGADRDLIVGDFNNYGAEARIITEYQIKNKKSFLLLGSKFYKANNSNQQGPGSNASDANFNFLADLTSDVPFRSDYNNPNLNLSFFGENIIYINDKLSITPGFRLEYINTKSDGFVEQRFQDAAGNETGRSITNEDLTNKRTFALLGIGSSYKWKPALEFYGNVSQNYRSVTFSDINIVNPAFAIDPDISDERGFTADLGIRGRHNKFLSYDINIFGLYYNDRIGFTQQEIDGRVKTVRGNIGNAVIYGLESLLDLNLNNLLIKDNRYSSNIFLNTAIVQSEYVSSDTAGIEGNEVEFVPRLNIKTGLKLGYKNFLSSLQYSIITDQYSDATNADTGSLSGVIGKIPAYQVMDVSVSYTYERFKLEVGVNNLLDQSYFTRRATGYPGPGIIPSPNRNYYATLQIKL